MHGPLEHECTYWNEEYKRCYGVYPNPPIAYGVEAAHATAVQSAVMRYWVQRMKEAVLGKEA